MEIARPFYYHLIELGFRNHSVVAILGPRQCGKTTLAKQYILTQTSFSQSNYFDLEDPTHLLMLQDPKLTLSQRDGLIVIDEIQKVPDLFSLIRVLVDSEKKRYQFLILGSASRELIRQSSESLAGRIRYCELSPFQYSEVDNIKKLWLRGGYPRSYLAETDLDSWDWRKQYVRTYLEQDLPNLGFKIPAFTLQRFWMMLTHYHAQMLNSSELSRSLGVSDTTIRHYLDILSGTFMIRQLPPWFENISKRQVKLPKIYFRDSGLLFHLMGISSYDVLLNHPKIGACWEGFALEEVIHAEEATTEECYFWGIHGQAELDLLIIKDGKRLGFEFKYSSTPTLTKSMKNARDFLKLDQLTVIIPGEEVFPLSEKIQVVGLEHYLKRLI